MPDATGESGERGDYYSLRYRGECGAGRLLFLTLQGGVGSLYLMLRERSASLPDDMGDSGKPTMHGDIGESGEPTTHDNIGESGKPTIHDDIGESGKPTMHDDIGESGKPTRPNTIIIIMNT